MKEKIFELESIIFTDLGKVLFKLKIKFSYL